MRFVVFGYKSKHNAILDRRAVCPVSRESVVRASSRYTALQLRKVLASLIVTATDQLITRLVDHSKGDQIMR